MEITSKENIKLKFPLPIYDTVLIGNAVADDGESFSMFVGLDKDMVAQLRNLSVDESDTELQKNTSDFKRFGVGFYKDWYRNKRTPFVLVKDDTKELAAIVWFGPKPLGRKSLKHLSEKELLVNESTLDTENWYTISYRCYPHFRGKGLTKKFVIFATDIYTKNTSHIKLWAGINDENAASVTLAESLGLKVVEELSDRAEHFLVMTKESFD